LGYFTFSDNQDKTSIEAIVTRALEPEYRHIKILRAFALLKKKNIPFRLVIVGDGSLRKSLEKLARDLDIEKEVDFKGKKSNHEVAQLLQESNFYISMPSTEGVSASLFEAMACGCFPIVSDLPGNRTWINNQENGVLIPFGRFKLLAEELQYAFERTLWRKTVVHRNRKFIEDHANYAQNMKKIADAYHQLILTNRN
jgi:glycosyltransferase involved in cell wall biosynthesis